MIRKSRRPGCVLESTAEMLVEARAYIEGDAICAVLSGHHAAIPIALSLGMTPEHFEQPDYRLIWIAAEYGRNVDRVTMLRYATFLLRHESLWSDDLRARHWRQCRQSFDTLTHICHRVRFSRANVRTSVAAVMEVAEHQTQFSESVSAATRFAEQLTPWAEPIAKRAKIQHPGEIALEAIAISRSRRKSDAA